METLLSISANQNIPTKQRLPKATISQRQVILPKNLSKCVSNMDVSTIDLQRMFKTSTIGHLSLFGYENLVRT